MTTPPEPARPAQPPSRGWGAGRVLLLVVGIIGALIGIALLGAGGVALWADQSKRDDDGYLTTRSERFQTASFALATDGLDITDAEGPDFATDPDQFGKVKVEADPVGSRPLFVGIGPEDAVDTYLGGVAHAVVEDIDFDPFVVDYLRRPGGPPRAEPGSETFWAAQVTGAGTQTLFWDVESGNWSVVVMNADASRGVAADVAVGARLGFLLWVAIGLLIAGAIFVVGSGFLIYLAFRRPRPPAPAPAT